MAADPTLVARPRPRTGSAENRRLRSRHEIPGVVYGHGEGSAAITVPEQDLQPILHSGHQVVDLQTDGTTQKAIFKEVQYDTFGIQVLHFDLMRVSADEMVEVEVSIEFHGTSPGAEAGGVLEQMLYALELECSAVSIPDRIEVNLNGLQIGDELRVKDLSVPPGVTVLTDREAMVVQVLDAEALAAEQEVPELDTDVAEAEEPEVVGEGEGEDGEESDEAPAEKKKSDD